MLRLFKKKSEKEKLQQRYNFLMAEAHRLSHIYRRHSDTKLYEAERIMDQIIRMK